MAYLLYRSTYFGQRGKGSTFQAGTQDFDHVRVSYSQLFNVLAMKFTSHGSAHIQSTEISVMTNRLLPMLEARASDDRASALQRLRSMMSSKESSAMAMGPRLLDLL